MAYEYVFKFGKIETDSLVTADSIKSSNNFNKGNVKTAVSTPSLQNDSQSSTASSIAKMALVSIGTRAVQYSVSNVGTLTGNKQNQIKINNIVQGMGLSVGMITTPIMTAITATTEIATTIVNNIHTQNVDKASASIERARNGYSDVSSILASRRH